MISCDMWGLPCKTGKQEPPHDCYPVIVSLKSCTEDESHSCRMLLQKITRHLRTRWLLYRASDDTLTEKEEELGSSISGCQTYYAAYRKQVSQDLKVQQSATLQYMTFVLSHSHAPFFFLLWFSIFLFVVHFIGSRTVTVETSFIFVLLTFRHLQWNNISGLLFLPPKLWRTFKKHIFEFKKRRNWSSCLPLSWNVGYLGPKSQDCHSERRTCARVARY